MDFGPEAATRAGLPMAANVVALERNGNGVSIHSQIYGGKMIARLQASGPALVMVSPGAYAEAPSVPLDSSRISTFDVGSALEFGRIELIEEIAPALADVDLTTAERIVCVGRGIGDEKSIDLASELSRLLCAEIAGSRPVVDSGWLPKARQVGKSGQKVRPKLYLRLGSPALRSIWKAWRAPNSSSRSTQTQTRRSLASRIFRPAAICSISSTVSQHD